MSDKQYTITADWMGDNDEPVTVEQAQIIIESFNMHPDWRFIVEDYGDELRLYAYRNDGESTLTGDWTIVTREYGYQIIGELSHIEEQQTPDAPEDTVAMGNKKLEFNSNKHPDEYDETVFNMAINLPHIPHHSSDGFVNGVKHTASKIRQLFEEEAPHIELTTSDGDLVTLEVSDELLRVVQHCIKGDDSFNHRIGNLVIAVRTIGGTFLHIQKPDETTCIVKRTKAEWIALKDEIQGKLS